MSEKVQLDVQRAKSRFDIALAETLFALAQKLQEYENHRASTEVSPIKLVSLRQEINDLTNGLAVLEQEYNELFVTIVTE